MHRQLSILNFFGEFYKALRDLACFTLSGTNYYIVSLSHGKVLVQISPKIDAPRGFHASCELKDTTSYPSLQLSASDYLVLLQQISSTKILLPSPAFIYHSVNNNTFDWDIV